MTPWAAVQATITSKATRATIRWTVARARTSLSAVQVTTRFAAERRSTRISLAPALIMSSTKTASAFSWMPMAPGLPVFSCRKDRSTVLADNPEITATMGDSLEITLANGAKVVVADFDDGDLGLRLRGMQPEVPATDVIDLTDGQRLARRYHSPAEHSEGLRRQ